jgi:hypothetical protein
LLVRAGPSMISKSYSEATFESLLGRRKRFRRDHGFEPGAKPGPLPVDWRALLGIKIGDLGFEPADRGLSSKSAC